jgi:hypothetical protein
LTGNLRRTVRQNRPVFLYKNTQYDNTHRNIWLILLIEKVKHQPKKGTVDSFQIMCRTISILRHANLA